MSEIGSSVRRLLWGKNGVGQLLAMENMLHSQDTASKIQEASPSAEEVETFWETVTEAKHALSEARDRGDMSEAGEFADEVRDLKDWMELRS